MPDEVARNLLLIKGTFQVHIDLPKNSSAICTQIKILNQMESIHFRITYTKSAVKVCFLNS